MSEFKAFPQLTFWVEEPDSAGIEMFHICLGNSERPIVSFPKEGIDGERLVECWNACRKIAFPAAHIEASDQYTKRLEQLRKDAWARVLELEAAQ